MADPEVFLGVSVGARVLYLGVVRAPAELLDDPVERIQPTTQLELAPRLADVRARVAQELRRLTPAVVGVTRPKKYSGWAYGDAFDRASLETAVLFACIDEGIPARIVRAEDAAKSLPAAPAKVVEQAADRWDITPTRYWKDRVWAFATAMALAKGIG